MFFLRIYVFIVALLFLNSCVGTKNGFDRLTRDPSATLVNFEQFQKKYCKKIKKFSKNNYSWSKILDNIQAGFINSVEEFLCQFEYDALSNSRGMSRSRSIQVSRPQKPRVIIAKKSDGGFQDFNYKKEYLFFSFNHPRFNGGDNIEMLRYNPAEKLEHRLSLIDIDFKDDPPKITTNSKKCSKCHGSPVRPLWNPFSSWPAAFLGNTIASNGDDLTQFLSNYLVGRYSIFNKEKEQENEQILQQGPPLLGVDLFDAFGALNVHRITYKLRNLKNYKQVIYPFIYGQLCLEEGGQGLLDDIFDLYENIFPLREDLLLRVDKKTLKNVLNLYGSDPINYLGVVSDNIWDKKFLDFLYTFHFDKMLALGYSKRTAVRKLKKQEIYSLDLRLRFLVKTDYGMPISVVNNPIISEQFSVPARMTRLGTSLWRYVIEGSGGYIGDWGTDILQEDYLIIFNSDREHGILDYLLDLDPSLKPIFSDLVEAKKNSTDINSSLSAVFRSQQFVDKKKKTCEKIKENAKKNISKKIVKQKNNSYFDHVSPMKRGLSCNSCHQNYIGYVNYYKPSHNSSNYPRAFLVCANCHSDKYNLVGPYIPFDDEKKLKSTFLMNDYWKKRFKYKISNEAKMKVEHMPPVFNLSPSAEEKIKLYIENSNN